MSYVRLQYGELPGNRHWTCTSTTREAIRSLPDPLLLPIARLQRHNERAISKASEESNWMCNLSVGEIIVSVILSKGVRYCAVKMHEVVLLNVRHHCNKPRARTAVV